MPRCFLYAEEELRHLPMWVRIHGLPLHYWSTTILSTIDSKIGRSLHMDKLTRIKECLNFAHILIELDPVGPRMEMIRIWLPIGVDLDLDI